MDNSASQTVSYTNVSTDMTGNVGLTTTPTQTAQTQPAQNIVVESAQNAYDTAVNVVDTATTAVGTVAQNAAEAVGLTEAQHPEKVTKTTTTTTESF